MMPLLSSSFGPGCKQVPPPTVHSALFIVLQPFDIISLRGEMSSKDQGHTGDSGLFTELQSQAPRVSGARCRFVTETVVQVTHRGGEAHRESVPGVSSSFHPSSYPLTRSEVTNQKKAACQALPPSFPERLESGPFDMRSGLELEGETPPQRFEGPRHGNAQTQRQIVREVDVKVKSEIR